MKTAIKVFEILALICGFIFGFICLFMVIGLAAGNEQIVQAVVQQGAAGKDDAQAVVGTFIGVYSVLLVLEVVRIVLTILSLRKVSKPFDKKPVGLGVLNIFFGSFIGGILLLCLTPENA